METIIEFVISCSIIGVLIYGIVGGWLGYKERCEEENQQCYSPPKNLDNQVFWYSAGNDEND